MKTIISSLALATILASPLAALADRTPATAPSTSVAMQQSATTTSRAKRVDDRRQAVLRLEAQSRQLGPTN